MQSQSEGLVEWEDNDYMNSMIQQDDENYELFKQIYLEVQKQQVINKHICIDEILNLFLYRFNKTIYYDRSSNESSSDAQEEYDNLKLNQLIKNDIKNDFCNIQTAQPSQTLLQKGVNLKRKSAKKPQEEEILDKKKIKSDEVFTSSSTSNNINNPPHGNNNSKIYSEIDNNPSSIICGKKRPSKKGSNNNPYNSGKSKQKNHKY